MNCWRGNHMPPSAPGQWGQHHIWIVWFAFESPSQAASACSCNLPVPRFLKYIRKPISKGFLLCRSKWITSMKTVCLVWSLFFPFGNCFFLFCSPVNLYLPPNLYAVPLGLLIVIFSDSHVQELSSCAHQVQWGNQSKRNVKLTIYHGGERRQIHKSTRL